MFETLLPHIGLIVSMFVVNFIGTNTAGTGLMARPIISWLTGLPLAVVIGTTRLTHFAPRLASLWALRKHPEVNWVLALTYIIPATLGGLVGTLVVISINEEVLVKIMGITIVVFSFLLIINPHIGTSEKRKLPKMIEQAFVHIMMFVSNIVASVTGGGGILSSFVFLFINKDSYIAATAHRKIAGIGGAVISAIIFLYLGLVAWVYVPAIMVGGGLGAYAGSRWAISAGNTVIRPLAISVMICMGVVMLLN